MDSCFANVQQSDSQAVCTANLTQLVKRTSGIEVLSSLKAAEEIYVKKQSISNRLLHLKWIIFFMFSNDLWVHFGIFSVPVAQLLLYTLYYQNLNRKEDIQVLCFIIVYCYILKILNGNTIRMKEEIKNYSISSGVILHTHTYMADTNLILGYKYDYMDKILQK